MANKFPWQPSPVAGSFLDNLYRFIKPLESDKMKQMLGLELVDKNPTIGVGYDLVKGTTSEINAILHVMGFSDEAIRNTSRPASPAAAMDWDYLTRIKAEFHKGGDIGRINDIMKDRWQQADKDFLKLIGPNLRKSFRFNDDAEIKSVFNEAWLSYKGELERKIPQFAMEPQSATSREILTMSSFVWNGGGGLLGPKLREALSAGNRAEAWFEVRYNSNSGDSADSVGPGLQKRRYFESEVFGLYNNPADVSLAEATSVLQMLSKDRVGIMKYEHRWGLPPDGLKATDPLKSGANSIDAANTDYQGLMGSGFSSSIKTLDAELAPAANVYLANLNQRYSGFTLIGAGLQSGAWGPGRNPSNIYVAGKAGDTLKATSNNPVFGMSKAM